MKLSDVSKGHWCPICKHKTEKKLYKWLQKEYPNVKVIPQKKFEWCKNSKTNMYFPFDDLLDSFKCIIELDGNAHFKQVSNLNLNYFFIHL